MWRDIALTNKTNIRAALLRLEQHLAHIREKSRHAELAMEFERAHQLKKSSSQTEANRLSQWVI